MMRFQQAIRCDLGSRLSMLAFAFSLILFYFLFLVGRAGLLVSRNNLELKVQRFISPAVGLALTIITIFTINRIGISVKNAAIPIFLLESVFTLFFLTKVKNANRIQKWDLLFGIIPIGVLISAWPILRYGFNWVSYVNDDMNNYVLAARRFYNNGFFAEPNMSALNSGSDYSNIYYFFHVTQHVRPGSDLFLAFTSRITDGNTLAVFMPTIVVLQMILISSTLALCAISTNVTRKKLVLTGIFSLVLPLSSLGFLYQLIGQVGGIAIGLAVLVFWKEVIAKNKTGIGHLFLFAALLGAQLIWYPEYIPFIGIVMIISQIIEWRSIGKISILRYFVLFMLLAAILQKYLIQSILFLRNQLNSANQGSIADASAQVFPYFLKPHGLSSFLGLEPLNIWGSHIQEGFLIAFSILFLLNVLIYLIRTDARKSLYGIAFLTQFIILIYFISSKTGFAAFKLSMYMQPILAIVLAQFFGNEGTNNKGSSKIHNRVAILKNVFFFVMTGMMLSTTYYYANASTGNKFGGFAEMPFASQSNVYNKIQLAKNSQGTINSPVISNAFNLSQAKIEAYSMVGTPIVFPAFKFFGNFYSKDYSPNSNLSTSTIKLGRSFDYNSFEQFGYSIPEDIVHQRFLVTNDSFNIINNSLYVPEKGYWNYAILSDVKNYISFVYSKKGPAYYTFDREHVAIFQGEQDPMAPGHYMQALGNHLLFQIFNPQKNGKFIVALSSTLLPQQDRRLPQLSVIGSTTKDFLVVGRGSARVYIDDVLPFRVKNGEYFQLNLKNTSKRFPITKNVFSDLYNSDIAKDFRKISTFGKDISFISDPKIIDSSNASISIFPKDLQNKGLFYSGIYEDGWFSENSYAILNASSRDDLVVKGTVPLIGTDSSFITSGQLLIDGKVITTKKLGVGDFDFTVLNKDFPAEFSGNHRVEVKFSKLQRLPGADGRPVSAKIIFMGFTSTK